MEQVLASQTLGYRRLGDILAWVDGELPPGATAKDIIMKAVQIIGAGGTNGFAVEFADSAICALPISRRMTICNVAVELGARAALMTPDEKRGANCEGKPHRDQLVFDAATWESDAGAVFDRVVQIDAETIAPLVS